MYKFMPGLALLTCLGAQQTIEIPFQSHDGHAMTMMAWDHSLGVAAWFIRGTLPPGHHAILDYIKGLPESIPPFAQTPGNAR
ncbi:MAG: hypothetical protein FJW20_04430 [Acidimicrobiia bacterium]|nr:hypothetical protein [Acidimicrobiia bacterium]